MKKIQQSEEDKVNRSSPFYIRDYKSIKINKYNNLQQMSIENNKQLRQENYQNSLVIPNCQGSNLEVTQSKIQLMASDAVDQQISLNSADQQLQQMIFQINQDVENSFQNNNQSIDIIDLPNLQTLYLSFEQAMQELSQQNNRSNSILRFYINYLDQQVKTNSMETKPEFKIRKIRSSGKQCAVCFNHINKNTKIPNLKCKHKFHKKCLKKWVELKPNCPLCRCAIK